MASSTPRPPGWKLVLAIALATLLLTAHWVRVPGYTDADYYMATAVQLAEGRGLTEPFIWNFLAGAERLPQPSHLYWMPLTTLLAAGPMLVLGANFGAARLLFLMTAACLPLGSSWLAVRLGATRREAVLAGLLAALPGFFLPFFATTDSFAPYALLATGVLILLARRMADGGAASAFGAGLLIGAAHLTRADGFLLLAPAAYVLIRIEDNRWRAVLLILGGYSLVMGPWMLRLLRISGSPLPPGASDALWLRNYDELFSYPPGRLGPSHLLAMGPGELIRVRLQALLHNLLSLLAVNGLVFLAPFMIWGGWLRRSRPIVQLGSLYGALLLALMSFVFPHPGTRGGLFHSSAGLMPLLWALAPIGLHNAIIRLAPRRGWEPVRATRAFGVGAVLIAGVVTAFLFWDRLLQPLGTPGAWGGSADVYRQVGRELRARDEQVGIVAVNNPPGFWLATRLASVVIPDGGPEDLLAVARDFQVEWVVLEGNHPQGLSDLYRHPRSLPGLELAGSLDVERGAPVYFFLVDPHE